MNDINFRNIEMSKDLIIVIEPKEYNFCLIIQIHAAGDAVSVAFDAAGRRGWPRVSTNAAARHAKR